MAGRTSKLDPTREKAALAALKMGASRRLAAQHAGVDETTFCRWQNKNANFARSVADACASAEMLAVATVQKAMIGGQLIGRETTIARDGTRIVKETFTRPDLEAAKFYLERRFPKEWGRIDRIEMSLEARIASLAVELGLEPLALRAEAERLAAGDID